MNPREFGVQPDVSSPNGGACGTDVLPSRRAQRFEYDDLPKPQLNDDLENNFNELKRVQSLLLTEKFALKMISDGASVAEVLESLCARFDAESLGFISSILLMEPDGTQFRFGAGPKVPKEWSDFINPVTIGPCVGSCGTAAFLKERVIASDISTDPLWWTCGMLPCATVSVLRGLSPSFRRGKRFLAPSVSILQNQESPLSRTSCSLKAP